jgi:iron-sulfur cluster assembly protein
MIIVTDTASEKIKSQLQKRGKGAGIKLGVRTTGCSGMAYTLEYVDSPPVSSEYSMYESNGVKVWINVKHIPYIQGLEMIWKKQGLNEGFDFVNPNEKGRCGCGESFNV